MVLNSFMSSNHVFKLQQLLNVSRYRNECFLGWILIHFLLCESVVQTSLIERDLSVRPPSLWAGGTGETHGWNHTLVVWMHCNAVAIVTVNWNLRQQGFFRKWLQNMIWDTTVAYTTAVLPGGLGRSTGGKLINSSTWRSTCWKGVIHLCAGRFVNVLQSTGFTSVGKSCQNELGLFAVKAPGNPFCWHLASVHMYLWWMLMKKISVSGVSHPCVPNEGLGVLGALK